MISSSFVDFLFFIIKNPIWILELVRGVTDKVVKLKNKRKR